MFNVGMYGGSFDPLHMGHINDIIQASSMCKELHIILSYSIRRDSVNYKQRWQWLVQATKDLENIHLHAIEDNAEDKYTYNWEKGAEDICSLIGKPIDAVFSGSDYEGTGRWESLYPESEVIYFNRSLINISSSEIRLNPIKYWDFLPQCVRPYYTKKVLVIGGESTGKSTLVRNLALAFNTTYLEEVGRTVCERACSEEMMLPTDFFEIMITHRAKEFQKLQEANKVLFIDTDVLTTAFYADLLYQDENKTNYEKLSDGINAFNTYDLVLFLKPDGVGFVQDGTRNDNIGEDREKYSNILKSFYDNTGVKYIEISGNYIERFLRAQELTKKILK